MIFRHVLTYFATMGLILIISSSLFLLVMLGKYNRERELNVIFALITVGLLISGQVLIIAGMVGYVASRRAYIPPAIPPLPSARLIALIPAYNEEGRVGKVVEKARRFVDVVIVVDDGSQDETAEEAAARGAIVIRHEKNQGYGAAVKTLLKAALIANARYAILLDADGQHDPDEIPKFIEALESGYEIVIGNRFKLSKIPVLRRIGIILIRLFLGILGVNIGDPENGFRAFSIECIKKIEPLLSETWMGVSSQIVYIAFKKKLKIVEIPVTVRYEGKTSTENCFKHGISIIWTLVWTWLVWSPLRSFIIALSMIIISLILLNYAIILFNITRHIRLFYTICSFFLGILGTMVASLAIAAWTTEIGKSKNFVHFTNDK